MTKLGEYVLSGQEINSNVVRSIDSIEGGGGGSSDFSTIIPLTTVELEYNTELHGDYGKINTTIEISELTHGDTVGVCFNLPSLSDSEEYCQGVYIKTNDKEAIGIYKDIGFGETIALINITDSSVVWRTDTHNDESCSLVVYKLAQPTS